MLFRSGCPVDCGDPWSVKRIQAAIDKAAHPSAQSKAAATACRNEALERVKDGCAKLIKWDDIKHNPPTNLKVSPLAAIPHKSREFCMILDLSYNIKINGIKLQSVNETSNKNLAPQHAMFELGNVILRIVWALATADPNIPFLFTKVDLKDGYWRMCVNANDAWNFAYVLPKLKPSEPTRLVIPDALQMGWSESPPFFCAATETARDVAMKNIQNKASLEPHPLESIMLGDANFDFLPKTYQNQPTEFIKLLEVYIDDFIGVIQAKSVEELQQFTRAVLHAIYNTFPPPELTGSTMGPPISEKKLTEEGLWQTCKEILGWTFDGIQRTIELAPQKCKKLRSTILDAVEFGRNDPKKYIPLKQFKQLHGKLQFATVALALGKPLMGPLDNALRIARNKNRSRIIISTELRQALMDWRYIIKLIGSRPTFCQELVPTKPVYQGFVDACKWGVGGVWFSGTEPLQPIVWFQKWPEHIQNRLITDDNPYGDITIAELELMGVFIQWIILEQCTTPDKLHCNSVAIWCDNLPAVAWLYKMRNSSSKWASRILRALAIRLQHFRAALPAIDHLSGLFNIMSDFASREHTTHPNDFLTLFTSTFTPPQGSYWTLCTLNKDIQSKLISEMSNKPLPMASWKQLPKNAAVFGQPGRCGWPSHFLQLTRSAFINQPRTKSNCWPPSEHMCDMDGFHDQHAKFVPKPSKWRFGPSPRSLNWTDNETRWLTRKEFIHKRLNSFLMDSENLTRHRNEN